MSYTNPVPRELFPWSIVVEFVPVTDTTDFSIWGANNESSEGFEDKDEDEDDVAGTWFGWLAADDVVANGDWVELLNVFLREYGSGSCCAITVFDNVIINSENIVIVNIANVNTVILKP